MCSCAGWNWHKFESEPMIDSLRDSILSPSPSSSSSEGSVTSERSPSLSSRSSRSSVSSASPVDSVASSLSTAWEKAGMLQRSFAMRWSVVDEDVKINCPVAFAISSRHDLTASSEAMAKYSWRMTRPISGNRPRFPQHSCNTDCNCHLVRKDRDFADYANGYTRHRFEHAQVRKSLKIISLLSPLSPSLFKVSNVIRWRVGDIGWLPNRKVFMQATSGVAAIVAGHPFLVRATAIMGSVQVLTFSTVCVYICTFASH
jgi:hypothetical protein